MKFAAAILIGALFGWTGRDAAMARWQAEIARSHQLTALVAGTQAALATRVCLGAVMQPAKQGNRT